MILSNTTGQPDLNLTEEEALKMIMVLTLAVVHAKKFEYSSSSMPVVIRHAEKGLVRPSALHITVTR